MSIPPEISFNRIPPKAYYNSISIQRFLPNTNSVLNPGDICRFNINMTKGFWDPYSCYINMEVDVSQENSLDTYDVLQIDGSASSFISELVITCKGGELERITEYDVIANVIEDISLNNEQRACRDIQGLGSNTRAFNKKAGALFPDGMYLPTMDCTTLGAETVTTGSLGLVNAKPWTSPGAQVITTGSKVLVSSLPPLNTTKTTLNQPYISRQSGAYASTTTDSGIGGICDGIMQNFGFGFSTKRFNGLFDFATDKLGWNVGIPNCFDNDMTQGCFEPIFSKGVTVPTMIDGRYDGVIPSRRTFCIPFYSGIFGQLMPKDHYKFVPMGALEDLVLEFRMNPNAMFTSGYKPYAGSGWLAGGDTVNKNGMIPRKWKITKFEIVVDILIFDQTVEDIVQSQLNSETGISFHTISWYLGPLYSIPSGSTPSGTYQLNLGFESLRQLLILFIPQDYLQYTFLRKLYRINCGITSLQFKIGMQLYPSLPIKGQAGTSAFYDSSYGFQNNNEYIISLLKAWDKFQNKDEDCSITANNFAVNERYWNPTETGSIPATYPTDTSFLPSFNTFGYMPLLHENRCKGKALYCMDLQSMQDNPKVLSGLNTTKGNSFELMFTSNSSLYYQSGVGTSGTGGTKANVTMYIFCNYDMVVQLKRYGVKINGRG